MVVRIPDRDEKWGDCQKIDACLISSLSTHDMPLTSPCLLFPPVFEIVVQLRVTSGRGSMLWTSRHIKGINTIVITKKKTIGSWGQLSWQSACHIGRSWVWISRTTEKAGCGGSSYNPSTEEVEVRGFLGLCWPTTLANGWSPRISVRTCLRR